MPTRKQKKKDKKNKKQKKITEQANLNKILIHNLEKGKLELMQDGLEKGTSTKLIQSMIKRNKRLEEYPHFQILRNLTEEK